MSFTYTGSATNCNSYIQLTTPSASSTGTATLTNGISQGGILSRYYLNFLNENPSFLSYSVVSGGNTFTTQFNSTTTKMFLNGNEYASCNTSFPYTALNSSNLFVVKHKFNPLSSALYINNSNVINYTGSNDYNVGSNSQYIWTCSNNTGTTTQKRLINPTIQNIVSFSNAVEVSNSLKAKQITTSNLLTTGKIEITAGQVIDFAYGKVGRETNAGKIGYETFGACNLHIVGCGPAYLNRNVKIWDNIDVEGTIKEGGSYLINKYALSNTFSSMSNYLLKSGADYMTGNLQVVAGNYVDLGYGSPNREVSAGKITYEGVDFGYLDIFGAGSNAGNRWVRINDKLEVGSINEGGVALNQKYALSNALSNLAIGTHNHDTTYLKLSGGSMTGNIQMSNTSVIEFGAFKTKQQDAGKITYGNWTANTLEIVGGHASNSSERVVKIYDKLNVGVVNSLSISDFGYGNDWQGISHSNSASSTGFALLQNYSGTTLLNCQGGQSVDIQESNVSTARFKKSEWMIGENAFTTRASNQAGSNWYVKTGYVSCDNTGWSGTTTKTKSFLIEKGKLWNSSTGVGGFLQVIIKSTSDQYAVTLWSGTITQVFANAPFIFESIKVADSSTPPTYNVSISSVDTDASWNIRFNLSASSARTLHIGWKFEGFK